MPVMSSNLDNLKDNNDRAKMLILVFKILIFGILIGFLPQAHELYILYDLRDGVDVAQEQLEASDLYVGFLGIAQTVMYIVSAVFFVRWFRRAYANLHRIGLKDLKHRESMTFWGFVIPIVSLFWPYQIMREVWDRTQSEIKRIVRSDYERNKDTYWIGIWWFLFLVSNIIGRYFIKSLFDEPANIEEFIELSHVTFVSDVLTILEALAVIIIVSHITKFEKKLYSLRNVNESTLFIE